MAGFLAFSPPCSSVTIIDHMPTYKGNADNKKKKEKQKEKIAVDKSHM